LKRFNNIWKLVIRLITGYSAVGKISTSLPVAVIEMEIIGYPNCGCGYNQITAITTSCTLLMDKDIRRSKPVPQVTTHLYFMYFYFIYFFLEQPDLLPYPPLPCWFFSFVCTCFPTRSAILNPQSTSALCCSSIPWPLLLFAVSSL